MSGMLDLYEFNVSLFDHDEPEEFLLFMKNFKTTLAAIGTKERNTRILYVCTLFHGEALRQFEFLSSKVENTETLNVD